MAAWLHEKKKIYWTWSLLSTRNWPIISEMAREFLKCENVSWDIYRRQQINDKHINKMWSDDFFPFLFPQTHANIHTRSGEKIVSYIKIIDSKALTA